MADKDNADQQNRERLDVKERLLSRKHNRELCLGSESDLRDKLFVRSVERKHQRIFLAPIISRFLKET